MLDTINGTVGRTVLSNISRPVSGPSKNSFSDVLKESIEEVARLQETGSQAVQDLAAGKTQNVERVLTEAEMGDMAFKTLLAIRAKLMDAYNEIKNIGV